jgi:hypothetical protein
MRGTGRVLFAAILLLMAGLINVVYGIGAIDGANIYAGDTRLVISDLSAYGWLLILLGIVQITGGVSLISGNVYGRVIGIIGAGFGAFWALISIAGANPWWNLGVFALCLYVLAGIIEFGEDRREERGV